MEVLRDGRSQTLYATLERRSRPRRREAAGAKGRMPRASA